MDDIEVQMAPIDSVVVMQGPVGPGEGEMVVAVDMDAGEVIVGFRPPRREVVFPVDVAVLWGRALHGAAERVDETVSERLRTMSDDDLQKPMRAFNSLCAMMGKVASKQIRILFREPIGQVDLVPMMAELLGEGLAQAATIIDPTVQERVQKWAERKDPLFHPERYN